MRWLNRVEAYRGLILAFIGIVVGFVAASLSVPILAGFIVWVALVVAVHAYLRRSRKT